jgi:hypothetical protein
MNEDMQVAWLEISDMLGEPTREELDVFLRTWQRASQATRKALAEQPAQRTWVGLTDEEVETALRPNLQWGKSLMNLPKPSKPNSRRRTHEANSISSR